MSRSELIAQIKRNAPTISVGMLTADLLNLGQNIEWMEKAGVKLLHFDVMDGQFCPMLTMGAPVVKAVKTSMLKDVHLMIEEPLDHLSSFISAGADIITFHVESTRHPHRVLQVLGDAENANDASRGVLRGIALNPGTPLSVVKPLLPDADLVLLLAVNPGWGGQSFIPSVMDKLNELKKRVQDFNPEALIMIDGGINKSNIEQFKTSCVDLIVTGSAVFDGKTPLENAEFMLDALR